MNKENYGKAFKEVYMILKSVGEEIQYKVPTKLLEFIEENMDKDYFFILDDTISLEEQSFMDETLGIISLIWRDYLCTNEEREKITKKDEEIQNKIEKERREKYDPDDLFSNKISNQQNQALQQKVSLIEVKESFFTKLIKKLKDIFHIN